MRNRPLAPDFLAQIKAQGLSLAEIGALADCEPVVDARDVVAAVESDVALVISVLRLANQVEGRTRGRVEHDLGRHHHVRGLEVRLNGIGLLRYARGQEPR